MIRNAYLIICVFVALCSFNYQGESSWTQFLDLKHRFYEVQFISLLKLGTRKINVVDQSLSNWEIAAKCWGLILEWI